MKQFANSKPTLQERFDALLISTEFANQVIGKLPLGEVTYEESEQGDARRRLLHVEKVTAEQNALLAETQAKKHKAVSDELNKRIIESLIPQFSSHHNVAVSILGLSEDITHLLDTLSTRACSVSLLEPIVAGLPWLHEAILKDINSPQNRRIDGGGKPIIVDSIRTALSTIGIENLKMLIPYFLFRYCIPQITDPYPEIKVKLTEYTLGVANAMHNLAGVAELKKFDAYLLGMLSNLGICASTRGYFKAYDKIHLEYSQEVMTAKDQESYSALQTTKASPVDLAQLYKSHAPALTVKALELLSFKRLNLLRPLEDRESTDYQALLSAHRYTKLKMLIRYRLIDKDEAKNYLMSLNLPLQWLEELNKTDLFKLAVQYTGH
ncbi:HDOD domain-containing protein [Alteromonas sp. 5E99-2]|uniref:HDOD domain-containing protein n=1 Tax=Alteromonas sp. 5E99-2 TaxID=2817683 RepID=UPI001A98B38C|nr:HDOD domain-containing protein [Alteromonas sp. 5E99-2]MBO1254644.1 HDOD domain-containing protein [Alteromonas sp. 5E99-2]